MKYKFLLIAFFALLILTQCQKDKDLFLISSGKIGHLTKETKLTQLDSIFASDSVVRISSSGSYFNSDASQIEIYEKGGTKLLQLTAKENSTPQITNIQVFDSRYKTEKGLHLNSTFKEVKKKYSVKNIHNGLQNLVVSLEDSDVYITIDKVFLSDTLRNNFGAAIQPGDIPDNATFKFFMVGWSTE